MKESGINYFFNQLNLNTGDFKVFYTFEEGTGIQINSISGGQNLYSGTLSTSNEFWRSPGSGYFSGGAININHASGLDSLSWTQIYVFEKIDVNPVVLFSSQINTSGFSVGITSSNKPYFESLGQEPIIAVSNNNYGSKNAFYVGYQPNFVTFGYYNFVSKKIESESFSFPFDVTRSDVWKLGSSATGYIDYFIHYSDSLSADTVGQLLSGLWARQTGRSFSIETICTTGITGYQEITVLTTGVTGHSISNNGDEGRDFYTGQFPLSHNQTALTGITSSGVALTGLSGVVCYPITGAAVDLLENLTGYVQSFGMDKIQLFSSVSSGDLVKDSYDITPFNDIYNKTPIRNYSGYFMPIVYPTGRINLFRNGVAQAGTGWSTTGSFLIITGTDFKDAAFFDIKSGNKLMFQASGTGYQFNYSGQEIFLNGINLISGYDFLLTGNILSITNRNTGISGHIFEYPIVLPFASGNYKIKTRSKFNRNSSNIYLNGIRQQNYVLYIEGGVFDLLSGGAFDPQGALNVYNNNNLFWE